MHCSIAFAVVIAWTLAALAGASPHASFDYNTTDQDRGPAHWFALTEIANNTCGGDKQSPIDIETRLMETSGCDLYMDYKFMKGDCTLDDAEFELSDHNVEVDFSEADCTKDRFILPDLPDEVFELVQAHIHTGTEHTFDGSYNAAELHLVHQSLNSTGLLAVIAIIFQVGVPEEMPLMRTLLDEWISVDQEIKEMCADTDMNANGTTSTGLRYRRRQLEDSDTMPLSMYDMIPANESFYRYEGGLTTPPCSEIVHWSVASRPLEISTTEESDLADLILNYLNEDCMSQTVASAGGSTSRVTQPLNGRTVELVCPASFSNASVENTPNDSGTGIHSVVLTMTATGLALAVLLL